MKEKKKKERAKEDLWESLKSVGLKIINEKKSAWQTNIQREEKNSGEEKDPREEKQKKPQKSFEIWGSSLKGGGDLLSRIALQYHRRKWA